MLLQKPRYTSIVVISVVLAWGLISYSYAAGDDIKFSRDGYDFLQQTPNNPPPSDTGEEQIAFPTAEGFGKFAKGGREGEVIYVSSLADSADSPDPGTLRYALEFDEPRIVVFNVTGAIELEDDIKINDPYLTIAGQTAPGNLCIVNGGLKIKTHDVVIRHLCIRPGDAAFVHNCDPDPDEKYCEHRAINILAGHDIMLDHISASWAIDKTVSIWYGDDSPSPPSAITLQWSIISEALHESIHPKGNHSKGMLIGDDVKLVSVHHNLFAHNDDRNPRLKQGASAEIINNVIYNWGCCGSGASLDEDTGGLSPIAANITRNYYIVGVNTTGPFFHPDNIIEEPIEENSKFYISQNVGNGWYLQNFNEGPGNHYYDLLEDHLVDYDPMSARVTVSPIDEVFDLVIANGGVTVPQRDNVDSRIISEVSCARINANEDSQRTWGEIDCEMGRIINSVSDVEGWISDSTGVEYWHDSDLDGIPNEVENCMGLDPTNYDDAFGDRDDDGYKNIEEYLNWLAGDQILPCILKEINPQLN